MMAAPNADGGSMMGCDGTYHRETVEASREIASQVVEVLVTAKTNCEAAGQAAGEFVGALLSSNDSKK